MSETRGDSEDGIPFPPSPVTSPDARLIPAMGNCRHNTSWTLSALPADTYYWSVQAVDAGFVGGDWAVEQSVTVP